MSATDELLRNAESYAASFDKGDLPTPPARKLAVLACMDARLNPYAILGLHWGLYAQLDPARVRAAHYELVRLAAEGAISPVVGERGERLEPEIGGRARSAARRGTGVGGVRRRPDVVPHDHPRLARRRAARQDLHRRRLRAGQRHHPGPQDE